MRIWNGNVLVLQSTINFPDRRRTGSGRKLGIAGKVFVGLTFVNWQPLRIGDWVEGGASYGSDLGGREYILIQGNHRHWVCFTLIGLGLSLTVLWLSMEGDIDDDLMPCLWNTHRMVQIHTSQLTLCLRFKCV